MSTQPAVFGAARSEPTTGSLFATTMGYVAATSGLFALGAAAGRDLSDVDGWVFFIAALACLFCMRVTVSRSTGTTTCLLLGFGGLIGLASAPTLAYYATADPGTVWQAGVATMLFMIGLGYVGYLTQRDLSTLRRISTGGLIVLIGFGIVAIFIAIPGGAVIYDVGGLVVFAGLTTWDFQRLRRSEDIASAPLLAASIFLDALNVFLFFLSLFQRRR